MIDLDHDNGDAAGFIDIASRLIAGAAIGSDLPRQYGLWVVRIDRYFARTWLGFRGKLLGRVGVHNGSLKGGLALPPFHPKRVLSVRYFNRREDRTLERAALPWSRSMGRVSSSDNVQKNIHLNGIYAWYSSGSKSDSKGAVMAYVIRKRTNAAWYTSWDDQTPWKLVQNIGIATRTCRHFINLGTQTAH